MKMHLSNHQRELTFCLSSTASFIEIAMICRSTNKSLSTEVSASMAICTLLISAFKYFVGLFFISCPKMQLSIWYGRSPTETNWQVFPQCLRHRGLIKSSAPIPHHSPCGPYPEKLEFTLGVIRGTRRMLSVRDGVYGCGGLRESHPWRGKTMNGGGSCWHCSLCLIAPVQETDSKTLSDQSVH